MRGQEAAASQGVRPQVLGVLVLRIDFSRVVVADDRVSSERIKQHSRLALTIKRAGDIGFSVALGLIAVPLMLVIATAIRLDSPGPAIFRATRIGRDGKHFPMLKFRTMVADADQRLHEVAHLNIASGMVKIPDDPRVTRVGRWLRRFSLDELPQLYNVLIGHMSLIGPRPHDAAEIPLDRPENQLRLRMRPGLTGLWQITARSDPRLETRVQCDLQYVHRWSLMLDAKILVRTIPAVVRANGGAVDSSMLKLPAKNGESGSDGGQLELSPSGTVVETTG